MVWKKPFHYSQSWMTTLTSFKPLLYAIIQGIVRSPRPRENGILPLDIIASAKIGNFPLSCSIGHLTNLHWRAGKPSETGCWYHWRLQQEEEKRPNSTGIDYWSMALVLSSTLIQFFRNGALLTTDGMGGFSNNNSSVSSVIAVLHMQND